MLQLKNRLKRIDSMNHTNALKSLPTSKVK